MSFQDVAGLSEKQCLAIASGFGAGAGTGELCGALTGAIMVLDLLTQTDTENAVEAKKRAMAQAKELQMRCAELLKKKFIPDDTTPSAKVLQLTGHCDIMIVTAVEIVEEMLQELKGGALPDHIQS